MNVTKIDYLFDLMAKEGWKYFTITNTQGYLMRDQSNQSYTPEQASQDLKNFLSHNTGTFIVEFRRHTTKQSNSKVFTYTINNEQSAQEPVNGIGGLGALLGGEGIYGMVREKDEKIENLNRELFTQTIGALTKNHEMQMQMLKQSQNKNDRSDAILQTALAAIQGMFGSSVNTGLAGFEGLEETNTQTQPMSTAQDEKRNQINQAVVRLMGTDSDFAENISKLADLAEHQPLVYKMAISRLNDI